MLQLLLLRLLLLLDGVALFCNSYSVSRVFYSGVNRRTRSRAMLQSQASASVESGPKGRVFIATTLDGKIAGIDGSVDFLDDYQRSASTDMGFPAFMDSVDMILMGRKSFDKVISFGEEMWAYGSKPVVVWTRSIESVVVPTWLESKGTVTCSCLGPQALFQDLKSRGAQNVYVDGGFTIQKFLADGLIHSLDITTIPMILGDGISLFDKQSQTISMRHIRTTTYDNGMVQTLYAIDH